MGHRGGGRRKVKRKINFFLEAVSQSIISFRFPRQYCYTKCKTLDIYIVLFVSNSYTWLEKKVFESPQFNHLSSKIEKKKYKIYKSC